MEYQIIHTKRCAPKNYAEPRPRNCKRSHIVQVRANNHFEGSPQHFGRYPPTCFLAITCTIWLCLEFRGLDSACFFSAHLLFFHARGGFWIPGSDLWTSGQHFGPGTILDRFVGPEKHTFIMKYVCRGSSGDFP